VAARAVGVALGSAATAVAAAELAQVSPVIALCVVGGVLGGVFGLVLLPMLSDRVMARVQGFLTTLRADPANLHPDTAIASLPAAEGDTEPPGVVMADGRDPLAESDAQDPSAPPRPATSPDGAAGQP